MSPLLFVVLTLLVATAAAATVTVLVDGFAGIVTFILCLAGAIIFAASMSLNAYGNDLDATRTAIEDRYDVDFTTGSFDLGRATFIQNDALYTCTIKGTGDEARMFCDEPPRAEYAQ